MIKSFYTLLSLVYTVLGMFNCFVLVAQEPQFSMDLVVPNNFLHKPWDLLYGPDNYLWVTERERGVVVRINEFTGVKDEVLQLEDVYSTSGQEGLLGIAIHPMFLTDSPFVYLSYTYFEESKMQRLVRYTYDSESGDGQLLDPLIILDQLPASNDHNSGRLIFGPDNKLYYTIGDQGSNHLKNYCNTILSQILPTQNELTQQNWAHYPGKILRLNTDGSVPDDNPVLSGVKSHVYTYGHRNAQGIVFGNNDILYSSEHGPATDDEVNIITAGKNYGWPLIAGFNDGNVYSFCNRAALSNCTEFEYNEWVCPEGTPLMPENDFQNDDFVEPIASFFAVENDFDFNNPDCENAFICRPNIAPSSIEYYEYSEIEGWNNSLLITSLKRGKIYRLQLTAEGMGVTETQELFYTANRYRDIAIHPDGSSIYVLTDQTGVTSSFDGRGVVRELSNPGTILKFSIDQSVSTYNRSNETLFHMYPNPANDILTVGISESFDQNGRLEIRDLRGRNMYSNNQLFPGNNHISIKHLSSGNYMVKVINKNLIQNQLLVVLD